MIVLAGREDDRDIHIYETNNGQPYDYANESAHTLTKTDYLGPYEGWSSYLLYPAQHCFHKSFHDYSPLTPPATSRFSPTVASSGSFLPPPLPASSVSPQSMSAPHRGLPPPAAMNLPPPTQQAPPLGQQLPLSQSMGQLPAPPLQWQGAEESMRNWLHAKAEEEKRKQEEEKTRQETLRLEQRKIEQEMLRTSLAGGIPPYMVPLVFAGMGGGNLPNASLEWAQHYVNQAYQLQQQQQQTQQQQQQQQQLVQQAGQSPPELRRESRVIPPQLYAAPIPPVSGPIIPTPGAPSSVSGPLSAGFIPGYQVSPSTRPPLPSAPGRASQGSQLPRLNTEELNIQQVQQQQALPGMQILPGQPSHALQQNQAAQQPPPQESQPSPSIYFHHWQPPASQAPASGNSQPISPDTTTSPRKRKATGAPAATSPPFSQEGSSITTTPSSRRRGHSRQRSDVSAGRSQDIFGGRHRHTESGMSTPSRTSALPSQPQSAYANPLSAPQEVLSSMQSVLSFSQSQQQSRFPQEQRYDTRQPPQGEQRRRYSAGPADPRLEEQQRRITPPKRDGLQQPPHQLTEASQPPR